MTAVDYAELIARIARASKRMESALKVEYERALTVFVGFPQDRKDFEASAPYALILPVEETNETDSRSISVTLELGVYDKRIIMKNGIEELAAFDVLSRLVPLLAGEIADHVRGAAPTVNVQTMGVNYYQTGFPLVTSSVALTIIEPLPIGYRRSV